MRYSAYRRFPGSFDPSARKYTRMDSLRHGREKDRHVMQYQDGLGWQTVEPYQVSDINLVTFTSSGTYTPPDNLVYLEVSVVGGGGGGGGTTTGGRGGGGGGGGGTAKKAILAEDLNASETVTIGAAGTRGNDSPANGTDGGTSSFGSHCSATGGKGGITDTGSGANGGLGGMGSGGDENLPGEAGGDGTSSRGGKGGNSTAGVGGASRSTDGSGLAGSGRGAGGGAGLNLASSGDIGAAGTAGAVYIREYLA